MCFGIAKFWCLSLHNWIFLLSPLYAHARYTQKEKYAKKIKSKKNQNVSKYGCKCVSRRCGSYRMYLKGDSPHQIVLIVCVCVFDFLIFQIVITWDTYTILLCFHTQHTNFSLLLIHVQVQCDLAITKNTCVNICSLNCLNLFLKYKIG